MLRSRSEWFRNKLWSDEIERSFFSRLDRARTQRDQYLVIQAIELVESQPEITVRLVDIYFATRTVAFHDSRAFNAKAAALCAMGALEASVECYRSCLEAEASRSGVKTSAGVEYPYLVAIRRLREHYAHALQIAELDEVAFPIARFKIHGARALILNDLAKVAEAAASAKKALATAGETQSEFRYHRQLGVVGDKYADVISQLRQIAGA
jgi:hypothetical protein